MFNGQTHSVVCIANGILLTAELGLNLEMSMQVATLLTAKPGQKIAIHQQAHAI
jgi:hypothetical protein